MLSSYVYKIQKSCDVYVLYMIISKRNEIIISILSMCETSDRAISRFVKLINQSSVLLML